jgi:hypothetical protein
VPGTGDSALAAPPRGACGDQALDVLKGFWELASFSLSVRADTFVVDRSGSTAAKDIEVSEKSPAGAAIPVFALSRRAERARLGLVLVCPAVLFSRR